jgi:acetyl esterase/lipase
MSVFRPISASLVVIGTLAGCEDASTASRPAYNLISGFSYGPEPGQQLDLYLQTSSYDPTDGSPSVRPTLLFFHGGGWIAADTAGLAPLFLPFIERGWQVAYATYRLGRGTAPAAVEDGVCALRWLVDHAGEHSIDTRKIVVSGFSAGGHLALTTGVLGSRPGHVCSPGEGFQVAAMINWAGVTEIESVERYLAAERAFANYALDWIGDPVRIRDVSRASSPVRLIEEGVPPILTVHGDADGVVPYAQALTLHTRLDYLDATHLLVTMRGVGHRVPPKEQHESVFESVFGFLEADAGIR